MFLSKHVHKDAWLRNPARRGSAKKIRHSRLNFLTLKFLDMHQHRPNMFPGTLFESCFRAGLRFRPNLAEQMADVGQVWTNFDRRIWPNLSPKLALICQLSARSGPLQQPAREHNPNHLPRSMFRVVLEHVLVVCLKDGVAESMLFA